MDDSVLKKEARWLDLAAPPLAVCSRCGRSTWAMKDVGTEDRMPQPDGNPCGGRFEDPTAEGATRV